MWDALVAWFQSPGGARVLQTAIIPALAILVAGVLAALIARAAVRAVIQRSERAEASAAVAALVAAARAAADPDADRSAERHAARLRTEADVRARLLPLNGAESAADWAASRIDAVQQRAADGPVSRELDELRDRLVDWVRRPSRAKRIFAAPVAPAAPADGGEKVADPVQAEPVPEPGAATLTAAPLQPAQQDSERSEPDRFARPAAVPGPRRAAAEPEPQPTAAEAVPQAPVTALSTTPADPSPAVAVAVAAGEVPAWQRTRAGERLQQERGRGRSLDGPTDDDEEEEAGPAPESTAPVQLQHAHRAPNTLPADSDEAIRLEAHQQARHARPDQSPTGAIPSQTTTATSSVPTTPATAPAPPATPTPAWLDTYDDEAQVTQNLDLKTPPPVSASSVRGRGTPGEDLVPRS